MSCADQSAVRYDFDQPVGRRGTCSIKWERYGPEVLPLWIADMDFPAPPPVLEALRCRLDQGVLGYGAVSASLSSAICDYHRKHHAWHLKPEWVVFLPSLVPAVNLVCRAFAGPGDEVMMLSPAYPPFLAAPGLQGSQAITVSSELVAGRWRLPLEEMEAAVTERTRVLLFCHPHNPLGRVWTRSEVRSVIDFCRRHELVLCSDEIHSDLRLDDLPHVPPAAMEGAKDLTITVTAPSKSYNLAGLGFAYAVIENDDLRRRFCAAGEGLFEYDCPTVLGAVACEAAYREAGPWLAQLLEYLRANRDLVERVVLERLPRVRITHVEATYLAWLDAREAGASEPVSACLAAGVALSDGADFGAPGFLRLNFACQRSVLERALERVVSALA